MLEFFKMIYKASLFNISWKMLSYYYQSNHS